MIVLSKFDDGTNPPDVDAKIKSETKEVMNTQNKHKLDKEAAKEEFQQLSDEDKVFRIRRKLEKIIH